MNEREKLKSRLGFILLSAGCAIGIGNVWKFPYAAGQGGGGAFVLFYLLFLLLLGLPIMTMEFAVGRASQKSPVKAYQALEKPGQKWHIHGYITLIGCYLLMMFYTTVTGWMLHYFYLSVSGQFAGLDAQGVSDQFTEMLGKPQIMGFWMIVVVCAGVFVCSRGLQNGLEKVTKVMMTALLCIMVVLAINSFFMDGASAPEREIKTEYLDADYAVRISGKSMEPTITDGSIVFVKHVNELNEGDIGIFLVDGNVMCKRYCLDGGEKWLRPDNESPEFNAIRIKEGMNCLLQGKVLG